MTWIIAVLLLVAGAAGFFAWAGRQAAKTHAAFGPRDVEEALSEIVEAEPDYLDDWDLFLAWPIDDPYLESIRQRCIRIVEEHPGNQPTEDISEAGCEKIAALLQELRERTGLRSGG